MLNRPRFQSVKALEAPADANVFDWHAEAAAGCFPVELLLCHRPSAMEPVATGRVSFPHMAEPAKAFILQARVWLRDSVMSWHRRFDDVPAHRRLRGTIAGTANTL